MTLIARPHSGSRTTVLVVDGTNGRTQTASMLRGLGYAVESSGDAFYALALLASDMPIRAIIIDMDPGSDFDARSLVAQALSLRPILPVVLYTADADKFRGHTMSTKLRLLKKPFNVNDLSKAITDAVKIAVHRNVRNNDTVEAGAKPAATAVPQHQPRT